MKEKMLEKEQLSRNLEDQVNSYGDKFNISQCPVQKSAAMHNNLIKPYQFF